MNHHLRHRRSLIPESEKDVATRRDAPSRAVSVNYSEKIALDIVKLDLVVAHLSVLNPVLFDA
jgi:hypothetical protein